MRSETATARLRRTSQSALRWVAPLSALLVLAALPAAAQSPEACAALRARIDALAPGGDVGRDAFAIRQNQRELDRVRAYADDSGCGGGSVFDDPDSPECRALLRRADDLRRTIARISAAPAGGGSDEERRAAIEDYATFCGDGGTQAALPTPDALVPVDPDAPDASVPAPAPVDHVARVLCVRHCDGAFYPLAVDVPNDRLEGLDRLCQAQCPAAASSLYTDATGDVAEARAIDGTSYSALPDAFRFQKATSPTCACRAPGASWAETLAKAEAMIEPRKGDVTVTPEIQAQMALPQPAPEPKPPGAKSVPGPAVSKRVKPVPHPPRALPDRDAANPGEDLTRELRRSVPTL